MPLRELVILVFAALVATSAPAQSSAAVGYALDYRSAGTHVHVHIYLPEPVAAPVSFVMPRGYPGGSSVVHYDRFVEHLAASSGSSALGAAAEEDGPRGVSVRSGTGYWISSTTWTSRAWNTRYRLASSRRSSVTEFRNTVRAIEERNGTKAAVVK